MKTTVINDQIDGSVPQVTKWLHRILVNWDSYEPLDWSNVIKVDCPPYRYIVTHKFVHKNAIGFEEQCALTVYLDANGNVVKFYKWEPQGP